MLSLTISIIAALAALGALYFALRRDMMMLQQNSNRNDRYKRWMKANGESTRFSRLACMIAAGIFLLANVPMVASTALIGILAIFNLIKLAAAKYKKPLVMTKRTMRTLSVAVLLCAAFACVAFFLGDILKRDVNAIQGAAFMLTVEYSVSYLFLLVANTLLKPVERRINKKYYDEAASILASMPDLKVIGVTGSYGKTSTKHYLYRILSEEYNVLMTPGNFNTTLGVIRTVREQMKPYIEIFIAEMGAKQPNDIKEICDLVHPHIGIITAVGPQHLESFKTIERVQTTKFELADSLPADGLAVLNDDFEFIANRKVDNVHALRYAVEPTHPADFHAKNIEYTATGTDFTIADSKGDVITLHTRLVGRCNVSNLMAAVIVALHLGMSHEKIRYAVERIEQVEHRLSIKRTASGVNIIDDAYNSNPVGSEMALEVLGGMTGGKRIIITPGMIELGDEQFALNREFGCKIAEAADVAIIVGRYNRDAITEGIASKADGPQVITVDTFNEAQTAMIDIAIAGDTVLYENDLPDTFK